MNAYELADELRKMFQGQEYDRLIHEIPDVLRQQADRIAELDAEIQEQKKVFDDEVQSYINDVRMFERRVTYFASKRNIWMRKYNEKCQEISKMKGGK